MLKDGEEDYLVWEGIEEVSPEFQRERELEVDVDADY